MFKQTNAQMNIFHKCAITQMHKLTDVLLFVYRCKFKI